MQEAHDVMQELQRQVDSQQEDYKVTVHMYVKESDALKSMLACAELYSDGIVSRSRVPKLELMEIQNQFNT